ncbi:MAG: right-handed parallel beta-helix repeat-containing protein, partial [Promethearchaeota archaeon]
MRRKVVKISLLVVSLMISFALPIVAVSTKKKEWILEYPIIIDDLSDDSTWADWVDEPWLKGSGTEEDPYMIKNVVIDGGGSLPFCMKISNSRAFFKIQDCSFSNAVVAGLLLVNTQNGFVFKNSFLANGLGQGAGIVLMYSSYNRIQKNICNENGPIGIYLQYSNDNIIKQNLCQRNYWAGIYIGESSSNNKVTKNECYENMDGVLIFNSASNNEISGNDFSNNTGNGIYLQNNANNNLITRNDCNN